MASFWSWWLSSSHWATGLGMALSSILILMVLGLPAWLFFAVMRLSVPRFDTPIPSLRVTFVFTKTRSEPWPVVQRSIEGALRQEGVGYYDIWLADEDPDEPTLQWCVANGVKVISRRGISTYHRDRWPRRTRSKEGNLAYFYDQVGYQDYDVVCQFDADHVPQPTYLLHVLPAFSDPRVGFVATPSICDTNAGRSWSARGRLHREATLHGPLQAGQNDGYAPTCIGSHYAVRTSALREIGGIGPELAEDFSTSFLLHAHGWKGVFALDAIANGEGPETFADAMTQELQWSRSLTLFLLRYTGPHWVNLQMSERIKLAYAQLWYPLFALQMVIGFVFPIVALVTGTPWVHVNLAQYLIYAATPGLVLISMVLWLRSKGWLRPRLAPVVSWEAYLFQLARWPWVVLGVGQAVAGRLLHREFNFKVTPKGTGSRPLPLRATAPYLVLSLVPSAAAALLPFSDAEGYRLLVLANAVLYGVVAVSVSLLHWSENGLARGVRTGLLLSGSVVLVSLAGLLWHFETVSIVLSAPAIREALTEGRGPALFGAALGALLLMRVVLPAAESPPPAVHSVPTTRPDTDAGEPADAEDRSDEAWWALALATALLADGQSSRPAT